MDYPQNVDPFVPSGSRGISLSDQSLRHLAAIVESSEDAIVGKDLEGKIIFWNPGAERMFGYSADEILGRPISVLMPVGHKQDMLDILSKIRRGEHVEHFETERVKKNGEVIPVSLSVSPIRDSNGEIIGAAKIARDITERKRNEAERERLFQEAQDASRVREEFLSVAGHELRTPLTALQLQMRTLRRRIDAADWAGAVEVFDKTSRQFERLTRLTEEVLDVTRIMAGRIALELEETDLADVVREAADQAHEAARREGSVIDVEAPSGVLGAWDRLRLAQVATNLLSNALKYGNGKPIRVVVDSSEDWAAFSVHDQGIGMSPEDQTRIFDRFERAVSRKSYAGMGLGLWIAQQVVDAHSGRIRVESSLGKGSIFRVELPRRNLRNAGA